jgi:general secretion pathway protein A
VAGGSPTEVFTKDAVGAIYEVSRGIPRIIGVVCENALLAGYAAQKKPVDRSIVADVCVDLDLCANGRPHREDGALPDQDAAVAERPVPDEPRPRPAASRSRFSSRSRESRPESAEDDSKAPMVEDRTRIFRFF